MEIKKEKQIRRKRDRDREIMRLRKGQNESDEHNTHIAAYST
jgi:hypothetical protein